MRLHFYLFSILAICVSCTSTSESSKKQIMTVTGPVDSDLLGITLEHEHVTVDFIGAEKVKQPQYHLQKALDSLLPYFAALKNMNVNSLIECTPNYIGRDVNLLKEMSIHSGLYIITNTGYYAAANKKYLPAHVYEESAEQLANRWISEWEQGIDGTEIKPGFIKLGVGKDHLDSIEQKLVKAGVITHLATGLKIAIHTGGVKAASDEVDILKERGVHPKALIVVHSQNMSSEEQIQLAKKGAWVSLDGVNDQPESIESYTQSLVSLKNAGLLHKALISQDAYWSVIQKENNEIAFERHGSPYSAIFQHLLPVLGDNGLNQEDIDQLLIRNPAKAFSIEVSRMN